MSGRHHHTSGHSIRTLVVMRRPQLLWFPPFGCLTVRPRLHNAVQGGAMSKFQRLLWSLPALAPLVLLPAPASAAEPTAAAPSAEAEVRQAIRDYDDALRRADAAAVEKFWATEYTFVNPRGERLTRADRVANLRTGRTALDSLAHVPQDERIQVYGDIALYSTLLTLQRPLQWRGGEGPVPRPGCLGQPRRSLAAACDPDDAGRRSVVLFGCERTKPVSRCRVSLSSYDSLARLMRAHAAGSSCCSGITHGPFAAEMPTLWWTIGLPSVDSAHPCSTRSGVN